MLCARRARIAFALVLVALLVTGGCSKRKRANIVRYPDWEYQNYRRLAVLPFTATTREAGEAARQAEFYLVDLLTNGGSFEVATRGDFAAIMTEQDLSRLAGVADPATALPEGMVQVAQAVVIGTITECDMRRERQERRKPRYARDRKGRVARDRRGRPIVVGEDVYVQYRHVARVGGNVRVVDAATNRVLVSRTVPALEKDASNWNSPPRETPEELAEDLAREVATEFYRQIAPQRVAVSLDSDCLIVATGYFEGSYEDEDKIETNVPELLLVVRDLPRSCDRNNFRVTISVRDDYEYLVEHEFTWSPSIGRRGEVVTVPVATLAQTGAEKFVAKLFSQGDEHPVLERKFELVEPESD